MYSQNTLSFFETSDTEPPHKYLQSLKRSMETPPLDASHLYLGTQNDSSAKISYFIVSS